MKQVYREHPSWRFLSGGWAVIFITGLIVSIHRADWNRAGEAYLIVAMGAIFAIVDQCFRITEVTIDDATVTFKSLVETKTIERSRILSARFRARRSGFFVAIEAGSETFRIGRFFPGVGEIISILNLPKRENLTTL